MTKRTNEGKKGQQLSASSVRVNLMAGLSTYIRAFAAGQTVKDSIVGDRYIEEDRWITDSQLRENYAYFDAFVESPERFIDKDGKARVRMDISPRGDWEFTRKSKMLVHLCSNLEGKKIQLLAMNDGMFDGLDNDGIFECVEALTINNEVEIYFATEDNGRHCIDGKAARLLTSKFNYLIADPYVVVTNSALKEHCGDVLPQCRTLEDNSNESTLLVFDHPDRNTDSEDDYDNYSHNLNEAIRFLHCHPSRQIRSINYVGRFTSLFTSVEFLPLYMGLDLNKKANEELYEFEEVMMLRNKNTVFEAFDYFNTRLLQKMYYNADFIIDTADVEVVSYQLTMMNDAISQIGHGQGMTDKFRSLALAWCSTQEKRRRLTWPSLFEDWMIAITERLQVITLESSSKRGSSRTQSKRKK